MNPLDFQTIDHSSISQPEIDMLKGGFKESIDLLNDELDFKKIYLESQPTYRDSKTKYIKSNYAYLKSQQNDCIFLVLLLIAICIMFLNVTVFLLGIAITATLITGAIKKHYPCGLMSAYLFFTYKQRSKKYLDDINFKDPSVESKIVENIKQKYISIGQKMIEDLKSQKNHIRSELDKIDKFKTKAQSLYTTLTHHQQILNIKIQEADEYKNRLSQADLELDIQINKITEILLYIEHEYTIFKMSRMININSEINNFVDETKSKIDDYQRKCVGAFEIKRINESELQSSLAEIELKSW